MSLPTSVIHILSGVPLNNSYEHTLWFEKPANQTTYFNSRIVKTYDRFTYLRPNNSIKVAGDIANARNWNYLMFQNGDGKWYYHFITKVTYTSDSAVELHLELDVIQTFMFDWELKQCFIERMHTETDEIGEHTIPEGLETGPLINIAEQNIDVGDMYIMVMMSTNKNGGDAWGDMYGGVYSGLNVYAVDTATNLNKWLIKMNSEGYTEAIVSMWMYPKDLVTVTGGSDDGVYTVVGVNKTLTASVPNPFKNSTLLNGHRVRNNKLFCHPYTSLYLSNNMGGYAEYRRELFNNTSTYSFKVMGALSPDAGVKIAPQGYNVPTGELITLDYESGLTTPAYPTCAWNSDTYKVWLAQNQNVHAQTITNASTQGLMGVAAGIGAMALGSSTGNVGMMVGGLGAGFASYISSHNQVQMLMAQKADMALQPDQARGNQSGNINLTHGRNGFTAYVKSITREYASSIDEYFTRYGYRVNILDVPKLRTRETFTYIKTAGSLVTGTLGCEDQLKIQAIFDKGVTFWCDPSKVGDYSVSNNPI